MNNPDKIELFILKCASLKMAVEGMSPTDTGARKIEKEPEIFASINQFSSDVRENADLMSQYYRLFYMLENDIGS
ncbi:hypothetical protein AJ88_25690 [Mesorhizobium amorphae CCBAU 01583]|nr:hypothetical protein AJ88_25690 [Mesorhizobium amorphae CCBAU 01583]